MTDAMYAYSFGTGGWLVLHSIPLILSPETYLSVARGDPAAESSLVEQYLARSLGFTLIPIGLLTILLTGSMSLTSSFADAHRSRHARNLEDPVAPYAIPTMFFTTVFHAAAAVFCYVLWGAVEGNGAFLGFNCMVASVLAGTGLLSWLMAITGANRDVAEKVGVEPLVGDGSGEGKKEA